MLSTLIFTTSLALDGRVLILSLTCSPILMVFGTLDKDMPGPDHKASITPKELKELCLCVNKAEIMLGNEVKEVTESERKNIFVARKSIVAKRKIASGEIFSEENITCKRPGNGISPIYWYEVLGKEAKKDFEIDEFIYCDGVKREDE